MNNKSTGISGITATIIIATFVILLSSFLLYLNSISKPRTQVDLLLAERIKTSQFQEAKSNNVKNMVVCYGSIKKDGVVIIGKIPVQRNDSELFENLVIYSNNITKQKNTNNLEIIGYKNKQKYHVDLTKQICRVFDINKM